MMSLAVFLTVLVVVMGVNVGHAQTRLDTLACDSTTTMAVGERVAVQSPNFPSNYNSKTRCQYEITCDPRESTYLEFKCPTFDLESSTDCTHDRLIVAQKGGGNTHCGTDNPEGTLTTDGWTRLTFASNGNVEKKGFRCYIWCRQATTTAAPTTTPAATTTAAPTTAAPTTAASTTAAPTTAAPTTAAPTTAAPTTAAPTTAAPTTAAPTTAAPTTAAPTTAAPTTAAPTTTAPTTAAPTTAAPTTAAPTTAAPTTTPIC